MKTSTDRAPKRLAFQGEPGAFSDLACRELLPGCVTVPCVTFDEALESARSGFVDWAVVPVENSLAGRVADVHPLLPDSGLYIVAEHFMPIRHQLMMLPGARVEDLKTVRSHSHALLQCRRVIHELGLRPVVVGDTALAAASIAAAGEHSQAAIASRLAAELHGLVIVRADVEDAPHNATRFLALARQALIPDAAVKPVITTLVFQVRSVPAALYKALGGFATNGINLTKIESYMLGGEFVAARFYADAECHPNEPRFALALEELRFFSSEVHVLGSYRASPYRKGT